MTAIDYWKECLSEASEECGLTITAEQLDCLAKSAGIAHENYGMAFYSPPSSDRLNDIQREAECQINKLQSEFDRYRSNAEKAIKIAMGLNGDDSVGIGEYGEVTRYGGRTERIQ